jgi:hypothetical protein
LVAFLPRASDNTSDKRLPISIILAVGAAIAATISIAIVALAATTVSVVMSIATGMVAASVISATISVVGNSAAVAWASCASTDGAVSSHTTACRTASCVAVAERAATVSVAYD